METTHCRRHPSTTKTLKLFCTRALLCCLLRWSRIPLHHLYMCEDAVKLAECLNNSEFNSEGGADPRWYLLFSSPERQDSVQVWQVGTKSFYARGHRRNAHVQCIVLLAQNLKNSERNSEGGADPRCLLLWCSASQMHWQNFSAILTICLRAT